MSTPTDTPQVGPKPIEYLLNPVTNRYINKDSPLAKRLLKSGVILESGKPTLLTETRRKTHLCVNDMSTTQINDIFEQLQLERMKRTATEPPPQPEIYRRAPIPYKHETAKKGIIKKPTVHGRVYGTASLSQVHNMPDGGRSHGIVSEERRSGRSGAQEERKINKLRKFVVADTTTDASGVEAASESEY